MHEYFDTPEVLGDWRPQLPSDSAKRYPPSTPNRLSCQRIIRYPAFYTPHSVNVRCVYPLTRGTNRNSIGFLGFKRQGFDGRRLMGDSLGRLVSDIRLA